jgi:hypothetical protein
MLAMEDPRDVDLAALQHVPTTCVHDLALRLRPTVGIAVANAVSFTQPSPSSLPERESRNA